MMVGYEVRTVSVYAMLLGLLLLMGVARGSGWSSCSISFKIGPSFGFGYPTVYSPYPVAPPQQVIQQPVIYERMPAPRKDDVPAIDYDHRLRKREEILRREEEELNKKERDLNREIERRKQIEREEEITRRIKYLKDLEKRIEKKIKESGRSL